MEDPNVWEGRGTIAPRTFAYRPEVEFVSEFVGKSKVDYSKLFKQ